MRLPWHLTHTKKYKPAKDDPQAHLLYSMEWEFFGGIFHAHTNVDYLTLIAKNACRAYKVPSPPVLVVDEKSRIFGCCTENRIELNKLKHGDTVHTLVHELAHWITDRTAIEEHDHGPAFVRTYMELLERYKLLPSDAFRLIAKRYGVKIARAKPV